MIYLDNAATTQIDPLVLDAMMPYLTEQFGNPGSIYKLGRNAKAAVENARNQVARFLNAKPEQIIFTSGATEANNMVFTISQQYLSKLRRKHMVISAIEHQSVLKSARNLCIKHGFDITYLNVPKGFGSFPYELSKNIFEDTGLVSIMYANNEIGYLFDVQGIGRICQRYGILFHTDCVQAAGCVPIDVGKIGCDFATISSHKIHGPKGVGAFFIKDMSLFEPMIHGGGNQEFGMRGGTENVAGIVGFGKACELAMQHMEQGQAERIESLKTEFLQGLTKRLTTDGFGDLLSLNGPSCFGTKALSLLVDGVDAESLILLLDSAGVCVSAGSACNSRENIPSHVLKEIGLTDEQARNSFRISFSRMNTADDVRSAVEIIAECIETLLIAGKDG